MIVAFNRTSEFPLTLGLAQHRFDERKELSEIPSLSHPCLQIVLGLEKDFFYSVSLNSMSLWAVSMSLYIFKQWLHTFNNAKKKELQMQSVLIDVMVNLEF